MFRIEKAGPLPKPLGKEERLRINGYFNGKQILDGRFNELGIAVLVWDQTTQPFWASSILGFDPSQHRLRLTSSGEIQVSEENGTANTIYTLDPAATRRVISEETGRVKVLPGGLVLPPTDDEDFDVLDRLRNMADIARRTQPDKGYKYLVRFGIPIVQNPEGSEVELITLGDWSGRSNYFDRVVIDPQTRTLISREMLFVSG